MNESIDSEQSSFLDEDDSSEEGRERKDENLTETIRSREDFECVYEKRERRRERER